MEKLKMNDNPLFLYFYVYRSLYLSLLLPISLLSLFSLSLSFFKHINFFTYTKNIVVFSCLSLIIVLFNLFLSLRILETFQAISKSEQYPIFTPTPFPTLFLLAAYDYFFFGGKIYQIHCSLIPKSRTHTHHHTHTHTHTHL